MNGSIDILTAFDQLVIFILLLKSTCWPKGEFIDR